MSVSQTSVSRRVESIPHAEPHKPDVLSITGRRSMQEDRYAVLSINRHKPDAETQGWLLAVMDGHGGHHASHAAKECLPQAFSRAFKLHKDDMRATLTDTVKFLNDTPRIRYQLVAGTTLSLVFIPDGKTELYIAHLGDSPVLVFSHDGRIIFRTEEHNIITNPGEVKRAEIRSVRKHGVDRVAVTEQVSRTGRHRPQYIKDIRMDEEFDKMYHEILDTIERAARMEIIEYSVDQLAQDSHDLAGIMRGKGIQNTAELGAYAFDAILGREPDVSFLRLHKDELPAYVLLATDGILDIDPHANVQEVEHTIARLIAKEGVSLEGLARRCGGDKVHDNTTMILHKIG